MDDLTTEIITHHWGTMKDSIIAACQYFFRTKRMLRSFNLATMITLIPKKTSPNRLDYRPISCLGVAYKIISKILATRLMTILPEILNPDQTVFIRGRRITDAISDWPRSSHSRSTVRVRPDRRASITIDFTKAFDTLRWDAIDVVIELLGIDESFGRLVMTCVSSVSVSALVEGSLSTKIVKMRRGLR